MIAVSDGVVCGDKAVVLMLEVSWIQVSCVEDEEQVGRD
jgi:hypothetical protein